ncbi:sulfite exporter TauE/SafE family protein [Iamia majanohamensis]|uniref:Probable membrane transporter protein n=1 Tax=Iamia majanohamensis TaxID=467976 RepID=A0AAE9YAD2_9ACTN|nr:sulfite exporter TauE/SafE family protein [Iamia majanohamensis]WCO68776.1 sulfite exporter TauE/SafE family protein [Iamia majanohamensis]
MRGLLASPLGLLVGLSLGALGGGGSILAVPALVFGAGESTRAATSTSLLVVAVAALMGMGSHWRAGRVRMGAGLAFGAVGLGGNAVGTVLNRHVDPDLLLLAFSAVMVVAAAGMWRRSSRPEARCDAPETPVEHDAVATPPGGPAPRPTTAGAATATQASEARSATLRVDRADLPRILVAGTLVGLMTGFFGVGGGFVIVPALVLTLGFSMPEAVGTSLVVIAVNAFVALGLRAGSLDIAWGDALPFLVLAVVGTLVGERIAGHIPAATLSRGFVGLLVVVAAYTAGSSVVALV